MKVHIEKIVFISLVIFSLPTIAQKILQAKNVKIEINSSIFQNEEGIGLNSNDMLKFDQIKALNWKYFTGLAIIQEPFEPKWNYRIVNYKYDGSSGWHVQGFVKNSYSMDQNDELSWHLFRSEQVFQKKDLKTKYILWAWAQEIGCHELANTFITLDSNKQIIFIIRYDDENGWRLDYELSSGSRF